MPPWYGERLLALGDERAARIGLTGPVAPGAAQRPRSRRAPAATSCRSSRRRRRSSTSARRTGPACPCPTPAWAQLVYPDLDEAEALERLWRGDPPRPAARRGRPGRRVARAGRHARRRGRAAHRAPLRRAALHGPGHRPDASGCCRRRAGWRRGSRPSDGIEHMPNLPTEEVFTTPDPQRVDGTVASTKPLVRRRDDRARACACASRAAGRSRSTPTRTRACCARYAERDDGASRLGEVALVDGEGRIGPLGTVFYDTLLDENAAIHIALGLGLRVHAWARRTSAHQRVRRSTSTS